MAGLGLDDFLQYDRESRRKFVGKWQDDGEIVVWLSTRSAFAYPRYTHTFPHLDVFKDEQKGTEVEYLRFGRFVSPDCEEINKSQYFRNDDDSLKYPPVKDPFLLLREWLRDDSCGFGLDDEIFRFRNPKRGEKDFAWTRAELSGLEKRVGWNWNHSLDSKLEYLFVVCVDNAVADGMQIITGPKLLGDALRKMIEKERDSNGLDEGNPLLNPYAVKFVYDKAARSPMDAYQVFRYNRAELTDSILEHIQDYDFPSPESDMVPRKGDKAKLMAAMYEAADAAGADLPLDQFFVDAWDDSGAPEQSSSPAQTRQAGGNESRGAGPRTRQAGGNESRGAGPRTRQAGGNTRGAGPRTRQAGGNESRGAGPRTRQAGGNESRGAGPRTRQAGAQSSDQVATGRRRKRKEEPPTEPCEECGEPLALTATECGKCGAQYEIDEPQGVTEKAPVDDTIALARGQKCWSCGSANIQGDVCGDCGIDLTDDLPI